MVETFLSPVIVKLVKFLAGEVNSLRGVHRELKSLKDELEIIQPFLRDAEAKSERGETSDAMNVWLKQLREEADRIEDVVDEYLYGVDQRRRRRSSSDGFFGSVLRRAGHSIKSLNRRQGVVSGVRDIKKTLHEVKERGRSYGLRPFEQGSCSAAASTDHNVGSGVVTQLGSLFFSEDELVGIESTSKDLVSSMVEGTSARSVVSLVGEGGIGKTTLARKVYNDLAAKGHFDGHVWITVSQSYNVEKIVKIMYNKIHPTKGQPREELIGSIEELIDLLRQHLQTKRYVVVFDDVWQTDFWGVMKHVLPENNKGSRVIVTTRNMAVVESFKESPFDVVYDLKTWSQERAWELFCKNAFRHELQRQCPQDLEQVSREIASKCQGLPLVIVALAGLLSKKEKNIMEWQSVLDNLDYEFEKNPQLTRVSKVLSFSYQSLPYHLKSCFLYFGIFPEDYSVTEEKLYTLWIAEGFIESRRDKTLEQVAEEYLNELISRNLVLSELRHGNIRWCRVHDLIRDIVLRGADEFRFCQIVYENKLRYREKSRRLSIHGTTKDVLEVVGDFKIRSVLLFNINELSKSFLVHLFESFKLLKVLDLEDAPLDSLPSEIGNLFYLQYLNLRGTTVKTLPKSIGKLKNLQMLNVSKTLVEEFPVEINKLQNLRHLSAYSCDNDENEYTFESFVSVKVHEGIGCLSELQTLRYVEPYVARIDFVKDLEKLRKLKTLGIGKLTAEMGKALGASIEKMNLLEKLYISSISEGEIFYLKSILPPPFLRHLSLRCQLKEFPDWISKLCNLRGVSLRFSSLCNNPLIYLKCLPNLSFMYLFKAYIGEELHFEEGGFQKLKQLQLRNLEGLKLLKIDKGALPLLETFTFGPSPLMNKMPPGIQHLTNLRSIGIKNMPREFVVSLQPDGGPDYWKIQHVPSVTFLYKCKTYKLGSSDLFRHLQEPNDQLGGNASSK